MKKDQPTFLQIAGLLCFLLVQASSLEAHNITYQSKKVSSMAEALMREHKDKAMYQIPLTDVETYLPERHKIKRESLKLIANRLVPGKTMIRVLRHFTYDAGSQAQSENTKKFFSELSEDTPHTYVILRDRLIFTESACNPALEKLKDMFTKHFLISGLQKKVHYSGEFRVYKNINNNQVFVVFDNSSGTYKPPTELLINLQKLLRKNLNNDGENSSDQIYVIIKPYDQTIDTSKLFEHHDEPFIKSK